MRSAERAANELIALVDADEADKFRALVGEIQAEARREALAEAAYVLTLRSNWGGFSEEQHAALRMAADVLRAIEAKERL